MNRGLAAVEATLLFADVSVDEARDCGLLQRAFIVGWAVEIVQAFFLMADDIMDRSSTRRGKPCWYRVPAVDSKAVNDAILLESLVFRLIERSFGAQTALLHALLRLFREAIYATEIGQLLDTFHSDAFDAADFTIELYQSIVRSKTSFYSFVLPVLCGHLVGITHATGAQGGDLDAVLMAASQSSDLDALKSVLLDLGEVFQVQDDFLDCFGDPAITGKIGTDIEDGKCSWLAVKALELASPTQRHTFVTNYARKDDAAARNVIIALYGELQLKEAYKFHERFLFDRVEERKLALSSANHVQIVDFFIERIFQRQK